jgi:hypothetical protein
MLAIIRTLCFNDIINLYLNVLAVKQSLKFLKSLKHVYLKYTTKKSLKFDSKHIDVVLIVLYVCKNM